MTDTTAVETIAFPASATDHDLGALVTLHPAYVTSKDDPSRIYEITKRPARANERNYTGAPLDGGRGLRGPAHLWQPYTGDASAARTAAEADHVSEPDFGAVVTILGPTRTYAAGTRFVVVSVRDRQARLVKLGGDGGRYLRGIPLARLHIVDPATLQPN